MRLLGSIAAIMLLVCFDVGRSSADDAIPSRFWSGSDGDVIWVSASEAITTSGTLRPEIHQPERLKRFLKDRATPRTTEAAAPEAANESCDVTYTERFTEGRDDFFAGSFAELSDVAASRSVIHGVLSASQIGLHDGLPYTILQIDLDSSNIAHGPVYLMYPRGRLHFGGMTFCNNDPAFSELPSIGDQITFIASRPLDSTGSLYRTSGSGILYEHRGSLVTAPGLQFDSCVRRFQSLEAITDRLHMTQRRGADRQ
jgi:hypothetical protein